MASGVFGIGVSALVAFQRALATTGHNIANVGTPGYSRQRTELVERNALFSGGGFLGNGVMATAPRRVVDDFLVEQLRSSSSAYAEQKAFHELSGRVDELLAHSEGGILPGLDDFFGALQDLADHPSSIPVREALLGRAASLADRFRTLGRLVGDLQGDVNTRVRTEVGEINALAQSVAELNRRIVSAEGAAQGAPPNDLLDQREEALRRLAEHVSVRVVEQDDGALNVFIGTGQPLVHGQKAYSLAAVRDEFDPSSTTVAIEQGAAQVRIGQALTGGTLGGTLRFRQEVLEPVMREIGRVAVALAGAVNDQHRLGMDLDGNLGGDFFADVAGSGLVLVSDGNAAGTDVSGSVVVTDPQSLTASDYRIDYDGTQYTVRRLDDGATVATVTATGFPQTLDLPSEGLRVVLSGSSIAAGDAFLVKPLDQAAAQMAVEVSTVRQIAAAAPIVAEASLSNGGDATVSPATVNGPPPPDSNLLQTVTITFNDPPTTFDVVGTGTGNPTGVGYTPGADISYNGWTIRIEGTPLAGDSFTVHANTGGVGDNRNALALVGVREQRILEGGSLTLAEAYGVTVASVGSTTREAAVGEQAQEALLEQARQRRESFSGVNLDEEAARMLQLQQAYQAAAQVIRTASNVFDALLAAVRS